MALFIRLLVDVWYEYKRKINFSVSFVFVVELSLFLSLENYRQFSFGIVKMRFIHFTIVVCILSFSSQHVSCGFLGDAIRQGINTAVGFIKDIPNRIPTANEVFEFGKNILIGIPSEITINVIHEFCK